MTPKVNGMVRLALKVGSIAGALVAAGTVLGWLYTVTVTRPTLAAISGSESRLTGLIGEERHARSLADTLIVSHLGLVLRGQEVVLEAARGGIYSRQQINGMLQEADSTHAALWRAIRGEP